MTPVAMTGSASQVWRSQGDRIAFDDGAWEYQSRQFRSSAGQLLALHDAGMTNPTYESISCLPVATFLLSLAIEQVSKAYYLKAKLGARELIHTHAVAQFFKNLNEKQSQLMAYAEGYVVWAGRYPTPTWTKEKYKEAYDVPSTYKDGVEHIEARDIPNAAWRERVDEMFALYEHIHGMWRAAS